jgi:hypothetical protein
MFMLRRTHYRKLELLQLNQEQRRDQLTNANIRLQVELGLLKQARAKADADAAYWRERAERFLDQIALRQGIISEPTMTTAPEPVESQAQSVFAALGISEINHSPSGPGAATAAPLVTGVNAAAAQAAVDEILATI